MTFSEMQLGQRVIALQGDGAVPSGARGIVVDARNAVVYWPVAGVTRCEIPFDLALLSVSSALATLGYQVGAS